MFDLGEIVEKKQASLTADGPRTEEGDDGSGAQDGNQNRWENQLGKFSNTAEENKGMKPLILCNSFIVMLAWKWLCFGRSTRRPRCAAAPSTRCLDSTRCRWGFPCCYSVSCNWNICCSPDISVVFGVSLFISCFATYWRTEMSLCCGAYTATRNGQVEQQLYLLERVSFLNTSSSSISITLQFWHS